MLKFVSTSFHVAEKLITDAQNNRNSAEKHGLSISNVGQINSPRIDDHQLENLINYGIANLTSDGLIEQHEYENPWCKENPTEGDWPVECTGCSKSGQSYPLSLPSLKQASNFSLFMETC